MQSWIHVIEWRATVHPDVTALVDDRGASYTYAELKAAVEAKAGGWASLGVRPGDVVALIAKNSVEFTGPLPRTTTGKVLKRELRHP